MINQRTLKIQLPELFNKFDKLHQRILDSDLWSIYGCGEIKNPDICLVFMNPTSRNISSNKNWAGIRAPWIGTKRIWQLLSQLNLLSKSIAKEILAKKPKDWTYEFSKMVYLDIKSHSTYITNLSKSTQKDARKLSNGHFHKYLDLFYEEIQIINPKKIITFGNQVSSVIMDRNIQVSNFRKKSLNLNIANKSYPIYPVYYPVGQGTRNIHKAIDDIEWIIKHEK